MEELQVVIAGLLISQRGDPVVIPLLAVGTFNNLCQLLCTVVSQEEGQDLFRHILVRQGKNFL